MIYIAMSRSKVAEGFETAFEDVWKNRDLSFAGVPGFVEFRLLRGKAFPGEGYTLFSSHAIWVS